MPSFVLLNQNTTLILGSFIGPDGPDKAPNKN